MNLYTVLGLQGPAKSGSQTSAQELKNAYRRALLRYHPDKVRHVEPDSLATAPARVAPSDLETHREAIPSVDDITRAYQTLSNPKSRADYDRELVFHPQVDASREHGQDGIPKFHTGLDTVDLDDMSYDEETSVWYRACRCGQDRGYIVEEGHLEKASDHGEVVIGCRGCSLWLKVLFSVVDDDGALSNVP